MNRIESLANEVAEKINKLMPDLEEAKKMFEKMKKEYEILKDPSKETVLLQKTLQQIAYTGVSEKIAFYQQIVTEALEFRNFSIEEVLYLKEETQKKLNQENASLVLDKMLEPTLKKLENRQRRS